MSFSRFFFVFYRYGDHRYLHVLTHSFPTRRSSDRFTKTIRLVPTGDTAGSHLRNGLVSAVAARMENKEEALKEFGNFFPAQLKKGMLIRSEEHTSEL